MLYQFVYYLTIQPFFSFLQRKGRFIYLHIKKKKKEIGMKRAKGMGCNEKCLFVCDKEIKEGTSF